jgi:hypothetical protein
MHHELSFRLSQAFVMRTELAQTAQILLQEGSVASREIIDVGDSLHRCDCAVQRSLIVAAGVELALHVVQVPLGLYHTVFVCADLWRDLLNVIQIFPNPLKQVPTPITFVPVLVEPVVIAILGEDGCTKQGQPGQD